MKGLLFSCVIFLAFAVGNADAMVLTFDDITDVGTIEGVEKFNQTGTVGIRSSAWFDFNFFGIDKLMFSSPEDASPIKNHPEVKLFAMDNLVFNESTSVPEPATMLLFGTGLVSLAVFRKIRKA